MELKLNESEKDILLKAALSQFEELDLENVRYLEAYIKGMRDLQRLYTRKFES